MPLIAYEERKLSDAALVKIARANQIIDEYRDQGFDLTLRQLFYQFVSRGLIANTFREYKNLGNVVNDGRMNGMIDWEAIVDRTRELRDLAHWESPQAIVAATAAQFRFDLWEHQPNYVEVWIEKDALIGVIEGVCKRLDVPHFSCRGYTSQSEMWVAAQRIESKTSGRRMKDQAVILHLGDHDPSGIDMTRDIEDRLRLFMGGHANDLLEVRRIALNEDQVRQYDPPPNPAKFTDSRAASYVQKFGRQSWELDALDPKVIAKLIESHVTGLIDKAIWKSTNARQDLARTQLDGIATRWDDVTTMLGGAE